MELSWLSSVLILTAEVCVRVCVWETERQFSSQVMWLGRSAIFRHIFSRALIETECQLIVLHGYNIFPSYSSYLGLSKNSLKLRNMCDYDVKVFNNTSGDHFQSFWKGKYWKGDKGLVMWVLIRDLSIDFWIDCSSSKDCHTVVNLIQKDNPSILFVFLCCFSFKTFQSVWDSDDPPGGGVCSERGSALLWSADRPGPQERKSVV